VQAAIRAHRLVTLIGVGGVGKTRLALESVARLADEFPEGVWLFELAAVTDPTAVPDAVAAVLGVTQQPHTTMADSVAATLEDRMRLLVFDNCEHLRDATADLVEAILARSTTVKIVATSREGLGLADEQLWPVPSLGVGAGTDSAAVALFVERTRSVAPRFSLTDASEAAAVVEICNRVDGIPLAIELAASRMASMSPIEVRDRLDHRFRLLVGSRRGLERHQTLRHAVAWSYDLLGDDEKELLERCSVFAGGFDLESACAIAGFDEYAVLDLLDALVRKSLLVADRPAGRTRFSMLETIRQFAEEQLVARGKANEVRTAHSRYFAGREAEILAVWDSPRQRAAYEWLTAELANLRTAFRWAADQDDLDTAAAIAITAALLGFLIENNEPAAWAEELIEPARAADHPRLTALLVLAALCWMHGLLEAAVGYVEAGLSAMRSGHEDVPFGLDGLFGGVYLVTGDYGRCAELCRAHIAAGRDPHIAWPSLVMALVTAGCGDEARTTANGLVDAAEATGNPWALSYALLAYGFAFWDADPLGSLDALRRGLVIAQDNGIRFTETYLAVNLARLEFEHGDKDAALDYLRLSIGNYHHSGNNMALSSPLAILAALLHRVGRAEQAAIITGHRSMPITSAAFPEFTTTIAELRRVLGEQASASLARKGAAMTSAAMVTYAYDQIDQTRTQLGQPRADS